MYTIEWECSSFLLAFYAFTVHFTDTL